MCNNNNFNEIDLIKYPIFQFSNKIISDKIEIIRDNNTKWIVSYPKEGVLNSFDYDIYLYLVRKLYPFDTNEVKININDICNDINLPKNSQYYNRIRLSLTKLLNTQITSSNLRYDKKNKKTITELNFHIIEKFYKIEKEGNSINYKIIFDDIIASNLKSKYFIYHNYNLNNSASYQLLFFLILHKHNNSCIILSYNKICEILQLKEMDRKTRIEKQLFKYFDDIIKTDIIKKYDLYKSSKGFMFKIIFNKHKTLPKPEINNNNIIDISKPKISKIEIAEEVLNKINNFKSSNPIKYEQLLSDIEKKMQIPKDDPAYDSFLYSKLILKW